MKKTTFIRKGGTTQAPIKGTKISPHNGQLLISSGLSDFDGF